jgi:hypothetical protein
MLGHQVPFEYCRKMNSNLPCRNTPACWKEVFKVDKFIQQHYSQTEIEIFLNPPEPKLTQIYDLMKKAAKTVPKKQD